MLFDLPVMSGFAKWACLVRECNAHGSVSFKKLWEFGIHKTRTNFPPALQLSQSMNTTALGLGSVNLLILPKDAVDMSCGI